MAIRITSQMLSNTMLTNSNTALNNLYNVQKQILTGKKFSTATESPYNASQVVKMKTQLGQLADWSNNIDDAKSELQTAYDSLNVMQENVQRINDLSIRLANEGNSRETCDAIIMEVKERTKNIATVADTQYQGVYIFGGTNTMVPPYQVDDDLNIVYNGTNDGQIWERKVEVAKNEEVAMNVFGKTILGDENDGYLATVKKLCELGETEPLDAIAINGLLSDLQSGVGKISDAMSEISSSTQRLDAAKSINETLTTNLKTVRASIEETDIVDATSKLALYQTTLQASFKIGANLLNATSLLDYI